MYKNRNRDVGKILDGVETIYQKVDFTTEVS